MFATVRRATRRTPRSLCFASRSRSLSVQNSTQKADEEWDLEDVEEVADDRHEVRGTEQFRRWLEIHGGRFRDPAPRNWLGDTPFPLNPSFKPPTPVSDKTRTVIYEEFMSNPKQNSVRELAARYHLSIKRVDAILRLKGLEMQWVKNKPLQTGFVKGMEYILGVEDDKKIRLHYLPPEMNSDRHDVEEADALDEEQGADQARARYQRMFWEAVPEGKEPLMPALLEKAQEDIEKLKAKRKQEKADPEILPRYQSAVDPKVKLVTPLGRPPIKFIDVGGKYLDVEDRKRRIADSRRRSNLKSKQRATQHFQ